MNERAERLPTGSLADDFTRSGSKAAPDGALVGTALEQASVGEHIRLGADVVDGEALVPPTRVSLAWRDLADGLGMFWLWSSLAFQDIRLRYRGSILGPFWLTITTAIMVTAMGLVYAELFKMNMRQYFPYIACGIVTWNFINVLIVDGCDSFLSASGVIQQVKLPFSVQVYRVVLRNLIVLLHNIVIIPVVLLLFGVPIGFYSLMFLPGLAVMVVNGVWMAILFGMLSARFRDIPPIIASLVQIGFFITPVFWSPELLGRYGFYATLSPFASALDVIRAPLLGHAYAIASWPVLGVVTLAGWSITFAMYARFRGRLAYWV